MGAPLSSRPTSLLTFRPATISSPCANVHSTLSMDGQTTARRQAQRFLLDHVRTDWEWPNNIAASAADAVNEGQLHEITEYRERYYGTTSSEVDTDDEKAKNATADPYKFDSPDSVAAAVEGKKEERKRKRRRKFEQEAAWNEGLRCFALRRDAWTGATTARSSGEEQQISPAALKSPERDSKKDVIASEIEAIGTTDTESENEDESREDSPLHYTTEPLIPVAAPLIPSTNSLRTFITPKAYPEIFNKVVLSSRTPSVPINLSDMTKALVQGWKDSGEWPPKSGPLDPLVGRRRGETKAAAAGTAGKTSTSEVKIFAHREAGFLSSHPHVKRGVESMKKVFRLSGTHGGSHGSHPGEVK